MKRTITEFLKKLFWFLLYQVSTLLTAKDTLWSYLIISFKYFFRIMVLLGLFLWCYQIDWTFRGHDIRYDHGWHVHFQYHLHNFPFWIYSSLLLLDQKHRSKFQVYRFTSAFRDGGRSENLGAEINYILPSYDM